MRNLENKYPNPLKALKIKKQLTLHEVANLIHLKGQNRLSHWERGQSVPSIQNIIKLAKIYETSVEEFI